MPDCSTELTKISVELEQARKLLRKKDNEINRYKDRIAEYEKTIEGLHSVNSKVFTILSHDLRSPFNGLLGFANILAKDLESFSNEQIKEFADNIMVSAKALLELIDDLFNWAKLEKGDTCYKPVNTDIGIITDEIFLQVSTQANRKNIELSNRTMQGTFVFTDPYVLKVVLQNLVYNAVKFTNTGGIVKVGTSFSENENIIISVEDNGMGMTPQTVKNLFRPNIFFSTRGTENEKGSGLGLILCNELLKKNNGTISVESEPDKGSIFKVTLPAGRK